MKKRQLDSPDKLEKFANEQRYLHHKTWENWLHQTLTTDSRGYSGVCGVVCATRMQRLCVRVKRCGNAGEPLGYPSEFVFPAIRVGHDFRN
jgi:hypothetical protein